MRLKFVSISIILLITLITSACSLKTSNDNENRFMKKVPYPESTHILYTKKSDVGTIVLYEDETGFRAAFDTGQENRFMSTGNIELYPKDGFAWGMENDPSIPLVLFAGVITEEKIDSVIVKQKTLEKKATVINTKDGKRVWFIPFNELEESDKGKPDPLKIEALDKEGNVYWKEGTYKEGVFRGKVNN